MEEAVEEGVEAFDEDDSEEEEEEEEDEDEEDEPAVAPPAEPAFENRMAKFMRRNSTQLAAETEMKKALDVEEAVAEEFEVFDEDEDSVTEAFDDDDDDSDEEEPPPPVDTAPSSRVDIALSPRIRGDYSSVLDSYDELYK